MNKRRKAADQQIKDKETPWPKLAAAIREAMEAR
jgi:hypothetical protein